MVYRALCIILLCSLLPTATQTEQHRTVMQEEFVYWCAAAGDGGGCAGVTVTTCSTVYRVRNTLLALKGCVTRNGLKQDILLSQFPRGLASNGVERT